MALTLRGIPSLLLQPQHPGCERAPSPSGLVHLSRRCRKLPCIHCSAQTGESLSNEDGPPQQSWMQPDGARGDSYSGWSFLDSNSKRNKLSGFLKIGAGIALAVGFALVSSKKGLGNLLPFAPAVHQEAVSPAVEDSTKISEQTGPTQEVEEENNLQLQDAAEHHADEKSADSPQPVTTTGRVLVPPVVDHAQEQALAVLQSLKVVEPGVEAGDICTRREYARWLVAANRALARSSAAKVLPAMYIENATELAFDDVSPDDPDFPFIQGLAEAGLISSKLSQDVNNGDDVKFLPDSPLSRQDLVSWKLALEQRSLPSVDHNKLQDKTGFIDIEQIHKDAWPAIAADISAGERSIIASSFGYTRRFQPQKPVTIAQAAIALVSGEASEQVSEDLDRLEAEKLAEKAVAAEIALEARAQKEVNALFHEELESQKQMAAAAEALAQDLRAELERVKAEREEEKFGLLKERATVDAAKESISQTRVELDGLMQEVSFEKVKVVYERERLEKLIAEIEVERETLLKLKSEVEVEMRALALARTWAEDEAKKARAHAKVLEEARKRWEAQGIEVHVDKELDDVNIPVPSWQFNGDKFELEKPPQKDPMHNILVKADEYKGKSLQFFREGLHLSGDKLSSLQQKVLSSLHEVRVRAHDVQKSTFFHVTRKASEVQGAAASMASGLSSLVSENTHKFADGCRGSAEKLAQIFKN